MRVLVVDDVLTNRILAARLLEKRGHFVEAVENGREAIERLEKVDFDVVLMDVQMPVMDGIEAIRTIRDCASPVRRHDVPVVAISAATDSEGKTRCLETGANAYLSAPIVLGEFIKTMERYAFGERRDEGGGNATFSND